MSLRDDFHSVLTSVRDLAESPAFKDAVSRDIAALENAAANGMPAVEAHVAGWFGAVYGTDPGTGAVPVTPGSATAPAPAGGPPATPPGGLPVPPQDTLPGA